MFSASQLSRSLIRSSRRFHQVVVAGGMSSRPVQLAIFDSQIVVATKRSGCEWGHSQINRRLKVLNPFLPALQPKRLTLRRSVERFHLLIAQSSIENRQAGHVADERLAQLSPMTRREPTVKSEGEHLTSMRIAAQVFMLRSAGGDRSNHGAPEVSAPRRFWIAASSELCAHRARRSSERGSQRF